MQPKLDKTFDCLFCSHENAVCVRMDKLNKVGNLWCKVCSVTYQAAINHLSDPVDVYGEWVDACDEASRREQQDLRQQHEDLFAEPSLPAEERPPALSDEESEIDDF